MASHKSAKKRIRTNDRKRVINQHGATRIKSSVKKVMATTTKEEAEKLYKEAISILDKGTTKGLLPADVSILGAPDTLLSGEVVQFGIQPFDVSGNPIVADTIYEWSSADETVVAVDEDGLASARAPGSAVITLEAPGGGADQTAIVVVPGVFGGTLSANSAAPGRLVTATKAAGT